MTAPAHSDKPSRHDINQALSKALAFARIGKADEAKQWARKLMEMLRQHGIET